MKKHFVKWSLAVLLLAGLTTQSCKNKSKDTDTTTTTTTPVDTATTPAATPPMIAGDEELKKGVTDATKDYPGVTATVNNGEITLNGDIKRSDLQKLMPTLNSLSPKKINNNLTVK